jgi:hypothetical protein
MATPSWVSFESSSNIMRLIETSIIEPDGATNVKRVELVFVLKFQKPANDLDGGAQETWAGCATLTVVSEISLLDVPLPPVQLTEQVADEPCEAGGVQMETRFTLTAP